MKKILLIALVMSSLSVIAAESNSSNTSYSNGNGGGISGESGFSGTSVTAMREQIDANKGAIAAFIQSNDIQTSSAEVKEIVESAKKQMHAEIDSMSDREVLNSLLSE